MYTPCLSTSAVGVFLLYLCASLTFISHNIVFGSLFADVAGIQPDIAGIQPDIAGVQSHIACVQPDIAGLQSHFSGLFADVARYVYVYMHACLFLYTLPLLLN